MKRTLAILPLVALAMWAMKRNYADATVDELQWILGPTATLVTALTGVPFEWEPGQGYLSRERFFLIAKACAGINFMIAAFGMVAVVRGRRVTSCRAAAGVLLMCVAASYSAAVCVNAARIAVAMWLAAHPAGFVGMTAAQVHRVEGIACYFGGLVLLYQLVQYVDSGSECVSPSAPELVPLFWYVVITVAVPLANGAASGGKLFVEHMLFVLAVPLALVALAAAGRELVRAVRRPT
jgi:exosortase K